MLFLRVLHPHIISVCTVCSVLNTSDARSLFCLLPQKLIWPRAAFLWLLRAYAMLPMEGPAPSSDPSLTFFFWHTLLGRPRCVTLCCCITPLYRLTAPGSSVLHSLQNTCLSLMSVQALRLCMKISHLVNSKIAGRAKWPAAKPQAAAARAWPSAQLVPQYVPSHQVFCYFCSPSLSHNSSWHCIFILIIAEY